MAVSSPPGASARGILRLSGSRAAELAGMLFVSREPPPLSAAPGYTRLFGSVHIEAGMRLPAEAYVFRGPASYTRQDIVELHTVGSPVLLAMLTDRLVAAGARPAEPGEFTARAFLAGAMDLTRVEGVAAVIHAHSDAQLRAARSLLEGRLGRIAAGFRERLSDLSATLEAAIDFADEAVDAPLGRNVAAVLESMERELAQLLDRAVAAERLDDRPRVVLTGPPNAGKSTLLNQLTGQDRAIASDQAGTTRDVLTAVLMLPGGEIVLCDTAGLGGSEGPDDEPARLARRAALDCVSSADLIIRVADIADRPLEALTALGAAPPGARVLTVLNKSDRMQDGAERVALCARAGEALPVSALTGEGLDELRARMDAVLFREGATGARDGLALYARHRRALAEALDAVRRAREALGPDQLEIRHVELVALEVREALRSLSLLLGEVTTEDILGRIFARFCIGK